MSYSWQFVLSTAAVCVATSFYRKGKLPWIFYVPSSILQSTDIIFGKIRPYFHKVGFALSSGVVSTDSFVLNANDKMWGLLLMTVFDKTFVDYAQQTCKEGAKMPRADWKQMEKYPVLIPSESIRQNFEEFTWKTTHRIKALALQNRALSEARDRLLPKLISGEIEV